MEFIVIGVILFSLIAIIGGTQQYEQEELKKKRDKKENKKTAKQLSYQEML